eukprot:6492286-Amphidinium_carterae.3
MSCSNSVTALAESLKVVPELVQQLRAGSCVDLVDLLAVKIQGLWKYFHDHPEAATVEECKAMSQLLQDACSYYPMLAALPEALEQASAMLQKCKKMWELDDKDDNAYFTALTTLHNKVAIVVVKGDVLQNEQRECILTSVRALRWYCNTLI